MPFGVHRDNYYQGLDYPTVVKAVDARYTSTTLATVWDPAAGKKFKLLGFSLTVHVGVIGGAAMVIGDYCVLCDGAVTVPVANLGIFQVVTPAPGVRPNTGAQHGTALATANTSAATANQWLPQEGRIPGGYVSAAADNILKFAVCVTGTGAARDAGTGVISCNGVVWGHEV